MLIFSLSDIVFMLPFKNISVSTFSPDDRKWASGAMAEAETAVTTGAAAEKTTASGVDSLLRVKVQSILYFYLSLFISLIFCFIVTIFVSTNVFVFQRVVKFKLFFYRK